MVIDRQQTSAIYNDFTFREFITQFSKKARRSEHEQAIAYLRMALERINEISQVQDEQPDQPLQGQTDQPVRRPRRRQQDFDFDQNGQVTPITEKYVKQLDEQNRANKPKSKEELYKPAFEIIKKSFEEGKWNQDGTMTVLVRDDRYINGIEQHLKENGLIFTNMQVSRIMSGGTMADANFKSDSMWALVFSK